MFMGYGIGKRMGTGRFFLISERYDTDTGTLYQVLCFILGFALFS